MAAYLLLNTMGYQVYAHFCGENLKSTSVIVQPNTSCCEEEGMQATEPMDCCSNEQQLVQIKDQFIKSDNENKIASPVLFLQILTFVKFSILQLPNQLIQTVFEFSPDVQIFSRNISYCIFRI